MAFLRVGETPMASLVARTSLGLESAADVYMVRIMQQCERNSCRRRGGGMLIRGGIQFMEEYNIHKIRLYICIAMCVPIH